MNLNPFRRKEETRALTDTELLDLAFGFRSISGAFNVTQENAIKSTAVIACLIVRAETFAALPVHVYRQQSDRRDRVGQHPLDEIISREANPLMTSVEFWRWKQLTEDIRGHAFVRIERQGGKPVAFWPMTNKTIGMRYDAASRQPVYDYGGDAFTPNDTYSGRDILHFKGPLVKDAWDGTSLVDQAKVAIGLTITSEQFYERLLSNGNHFPGHLETESALKPEDITAVAANMKALAGIDHAGEVRIFDRGLKYVQNAMNVVEADLTNQQLWYLQEVCRIFRVPPPLVQDWSRSTYTNSEQADLWFAKHTILPIAVNTERVLARTFKSRNEIDHYVKFELDGLLRGDFKTRAEGYAALIGASVMAPQEARSLEDMNPIEGLDSPLVPLNMAMLDDTTTATLRKANTAGVLVRTGYDPAAVLDVVGLPGMPYADVQPVTLRPVDDSGVQIAPADADSADMAKALEPLRAEKVAIIGQRRAQDLVHGRDVTATREFALRILAPLAEAYAAVGVPFDPEALITEAIDREERHA